MLIFFKYTKLNRKISEIINFTIYKNKSDNTTKWVSLVLIEWFLQLTLDRYTFSTKQNL